jgi:hypothetical protein
MTLSGVCFLLGVTILCGERSDPRFRVFTTGNRSECAAPSLFSRSKELSADIIAVHTVSSPPPKDILVSARPQSTGLKVGGGSVSSGVVSWRSCSQSITSPEEGREDTSSLTHCRARAMRESGASLGNMLLISSSSRRNLIPESRQMIVQCEIRRQMSRSDHIQHNTNTTQQRTHSTAQYNTPQHSTAQHSTR